MPQVLRLLLIVGAVALLAPTVTEAHFKLVEPAPWITADESLPLDEGWPAQH